MTVTPLLPPRQGLSCLADGMVAVHGLIDDLQALQTGVSDVGCLAEIDRARARLDGLRLRVIAAAKANEVPAREGLASTPDWVAAKTRAGRADAVKATQLAEDLAGDQDPGTGAGRAPLTGTRTALDQGVLSAEHARVIADALRKLPATVTPGQRKVCETKLVDLAGRFDPSQLRRVARRVLAEVEPDPVVVDAHEDRQVVDEEDAARQACRLTFHDNDGTTTGRFTLPSVQADILRKIIDAMTSPRRTHTSTGRTWQAGQARQAGQAGHDPADRGRLEPAHARGLAFAQLLEHLPTDHLHGPATTQVTVVMDIDVLRGHLTTAGLDTDRPISAGEARRLACNSALTPAVVDRALDKAFAKALGGPSKVLDLGRTTRLFTDNHRAAVHATHTHCATRGCTRPVAWCELHHRTPWAAGGTTNLGNAVPLCGWHHRAVHHRDYLHTWHNDGTLSIRRT